MHRRFRFLASPLGAAVTGVGSAAVCILAVFLPWFASNLDATAPLSVSGWNATGAAKGVFGLALIWLLLSALLVADQYDMVRLDPRTAEAVGWLVVACALLAAALIALRTFRPPEPADLLTRDFGLLVGLVAAAAGVVAGFAQAAPR